MGKKTLLHILKRPWLERLDEEVYYFCETRECPVVYFSNSNDQEFLNHEVRLKIGLKGNETPNQLCYCFDYTEESILEEMDKSGKSKAVEVITANVQAGLCACEIRNPAGRCCLGNVRAVIKKLETAGVKNQPETVLEIQPQ